MIRYQSILAIISMLLSLHCQSTRKEVDQPGAFPGELVRFVPYKNNPVFAGTGAYTWDSRIRERGYILHEKDSFYLWYTGYQNTKDAERHLGYATSSDGYHWVRYEDNPVYSSGWVEDMSVVFHDSLYYMFAEGRNDTAHLLTSPDRIHWTERGNLDIRKTNGEPIDPGPYGTPAIWVENGAWYLFYERNDQGIWLAKSEDTQQWFNVQDNPVLEMGPAPYDRYAVAMNQVIKYKGKYYGYYHASAFEDWREWSTCVAMSDDLVHWTKYEGNPIIENNASSGILVNDGKRLRMYTMHPDVRVYLPASDSLP